MEQNKKEGIVSDRAGKIICWLCFLIGAYNAVISICIWMNVEFSNQTNMERFFYNTMPTAILGLAVWFVLYLWYYHRIVLFKGDRNIKSYFVYILCALAMLALMFALEFWFIQTHPNSM